MLLVSCEKDTSIASFQGNSTEEVSNSASLENRSTDCDCTFIWSDPDGLGPNGGANSGWHIELYGYTGVQYDPLGNPILNSGRTIDLYNSTRDQGNNPNFGFFGPFTFPGGDAEFCWTASITNANPDVQIVLDCGGNTVCWKINNDLICGETSFKECLSLDADSNLSYTNATGSPDDPFDPCTQGGYNGYGPCN